MSVLKSVLKMIVGLLIGVIAGLLIAAVGIVCFTDTSFMEFISKLRSTSFLDTMVAAGFGVLMFALSSAILISLHEAGHLVCGLLSGYRFVSFRIFNLTFIKINSKLRVKRYSIAGTGGQCLLTPPDLPLEKIPTALYNFGGVLSNIIAVIAVAPLLMVDNPFVKEAVVIFMLVGVLLILMNGIPMKISGSGNDAYNMLALKKNKLAKRGLVEALWANALIQNGVRPKDMPESWFVVPDGINYSDQLETSIPMMAASRLVDEMKFPEALVSYEQLYSHREEIIGLYVKEIECELVFLRLVSGETDKAKELLTPGLTKYIETYLNVMSSKQRILCAMDLFIDNNREKALGIYDNLIRTEKDYLLQGEVKSDLSIMKSILLL